jgi:hypothetical protein
MVDMCVKGYYICTLAHAVPVLNANVPCSYIHIHMYGYAWYACIIYSTYANVYTYIVNGIFPSDLKISQSV